MNKIFIIGHNKCGTRSFHKLFKESGLDCIHWQDNELANKIHENFMRGYELLRGYENYTVFSDMESVAGKKSPVDGFIYAYKLYPWFDLQYENSLFIYNYRPVESWIRSRLRHAGGVYAKEYLAKMRKLDNNQLLSEQDLVQEWRGQYSSHYAHVMKYFSNKQNLISCDIEDQDSVKKAIVRIRDKGFNVAATLPHSGKTPK